LLVFPFFFETKFCGSVAGVLLNSKTFVCVTLRPKLVEYTHTHVTKSVVVVLSVCVSVCDVVVQLLLLFESRQLFLHDGKFTADLRSSSDSPAYDHRHGPVTQILHNQSHWANPWRHRPRSRYIQFIIIYNYNFRFYEPSIVIFGHFMGWTRTLGQREKAICSILSNYLLFYHILPALSHDNNVVSAHFTRLTNQT
jgi:hypothetical protein